MGLEDKLQKELTEAQAKVNALKEFSDLEEIKDQWGIWRLVSNRVNEEAILFEIMNECDCCPGANKYALPYLEFECIRIYGRPCAISFAKNYGGVPMWVEDWDESEECEKFNGLLLDKISEWIDQHEKDDDSLDETFEELIMEENENYN